MARTPELLTKPVAIARVDRLDRRWRPCPRLGSSTNALTASHWVNGARIAGEQRRAEDGQERRHLRDREDDQQQQRQQVDAPRC